MKPNFVIVLDKFTAKLLSPLVIGIIACVSFGLYAVIVGQDFNWDLRNYHYYSGFVLLDGSQSQHILPAQIQTFLNPTHPLLIYFLITHLSPMSAGFLLGFLHGVNFLLIYLLAHQVLSSHNNTSLTNIKRGLIALVIAIIGSTAPMFISEIGTTIGDNFTSIFVLLTLLLVLKKSTSHFWLYSLIGGFFIGMATGLKLTNAIFLIALVGCGWWYTHRNLRRSVTALGFFLIGAALALLLFQGYWSWYLFQEYKNPLFPFFNNFFQSPYAETLSYRNERFLPNSFLDALSYPFQWARGLHPSAELPFRDLRFALLSILFLLSPVMIVHIIRRRISTLSQAKVNIIFFFLISYPIWILTFAIQRYIIVLELLSGLIIFLFIETIIKTPKKQTLVFISLAILLVITTIPPCWGRISWTTDWLEIELPPELTAGNQMFLMLRNEPLSYVIPSFPSDSMFVSIGGNFTPPSRTKLGKLIHQTIESHKGPIYSFGPGGLNYKDIELLKIYNLMIIEDDCICFSLKAGPEIITACPLRHILVSK